MKKPKEKKEESILEMFGLAKPDVTKEKVGNVERQKGKVALVKDEEPQQETGVSDVHHYKAFSTNNSAQPQLEMRLKNRRGVFLYYPFITHAEYQGDELLTLICHSTMYNIKGRNIRPVLNHFRTQTIEYIQEFDAGQFDEMPMQGEPVITEIEIIQAGEE